MKQNVYDETSFRQEYDNLRKTNQGQTANDLIEIPTLRSLLPDLKNKEIIDLGCGYGENVRYCKEMNAKYVIGTDISKHMIEEANKLNKIDGTEFKVLPIEDINIIDKKFDIVISSLAFHYIKDFNKLINDINHILKEEGYLIFSMEHPITTCINYTENMKQSHMTVDGKYYGIFSDYNRNGIRIRTWFQESVTKYHRNFEEILNTLIENGFQIQKVLEPKPTEEIIKKNPKYINQWDRPYFLFIKAKKVIQNDVN